MECAEEGRREYWLRFEAGCLGGQFVRKMHSLALGTQDLISGLWVSWLSLFSVEIGLSHPKRKVQLASEKEEVELEKNQKKSHQRSRKTERKIL